VITTKYNNRSQILNFQIQLTYFQMRIEVLERNTLTTSMIQKAFSLQLKLEAAVSFFVGVYFFIPNYLIKY